MRVDYPTKGMVLFILHLPPPIHGAALMGKYIQESTIISNELNTTFINLATNTKLKESGKAGIRKMRDFLRIIFRIVKALVNHKYELCYMTINATGPAFYKDLIIVTILKLFNKRIIYHFHNKGVAKGSRSRINKILYRFVFCNTKSILLSPHLYSDIQAYVHAKDVFYCANGIPTIRDSTEQVIDKMNKPFPCRILFLSNMIVSKGVLVLLDACKLLKEKGKSFECHFVGAWSNISEEMFNDLVVENELSSLVYSHGSKYNSEKSDFYRNADIFVFPTFYKEEAFPLVILEAMQYGLPVISTQEAGIPDIVVEGTTGFLVPPRNSNDLANRIELLINLPYLREKMGIAAKRRFDMLFTVERFERRLIDILKNAVFDQMNGQQQL